MGESRLGLTADQRLVNVYYGLAKEHRQVRHRAKVDGWEMRMSCSDFGDVLMSAHRGSGNSLEVVGFELLPDDTWAPVYVGSDVHEHLSWLADLAERGEWSRA